jgi:hypothetical protein
MRIVRRLHALLPRTNDGDAILLVSYFLTRCVYSLLFGTVLPLEEIILWVLFGALFTVVAFEEVEHDAHFA